MDPDRWEFASEWFLRGKKQLLKNIVRRKHSNKSSCMQLNIKSEEFDDEEMVMEIARLKQEQKGLEKELEDMNKRLEATERSPQQMMAFLHKVVEDPDLLPRMILEKERTRQQLSDKKQRLMISSLSSPSTSISSGMAVSSPSTTIKSEEDQEEGAIGVISSPETTFDVDKFCQSSPSPEPNNTNANINPIGWLGQMNYSCFTAGPSPLTAVPMDAVIGNTVAVLPPGNSVIGYGGDGGGQRSYFGEWVAGVEDRPPAPYPFSLLGGGF